MTRPQRATVIRALSVAATQQPQPTVAGSLLAHRFRSRRQPRASAPEMTTALANADGHFYALLRAGPRARGREIFLGADMLLFLESVALKPQGPRVLRNRSNDVLRRSLRDLRLDLEREFHLGAD